MKNGPIERCEWDFSGVRDSEIELCCLYEYGRNSVAFRKLVREWRKSQPEVIKAASKLLKTKNPINLHEWSTKCDSGGYPGSLRLDDPRRFLFYFPAYPTKPWQRIDRSFRERAILFCPEIHLSGRLESRLALANSDFTEQIRVAEIIQRMAGAPIPKLQLKASVRQQMEEHILAPGVVERNFLGFIPPGTKHGVTEKQFCAGGYCREIVTFNVNWARPNPQIIKDFQRWLESPNRRPHADFRQGSVTSAREHLKKLGALRILESGSTAEKACELLLDGKPLFANPEQFRKAKRQAAQVLSNLF